MSASHRVAVIPGDGVGPEVTAEAVKALNALAVPLELTELQWGSQHWLERGTMMERDGIERLRSFDAVLFGACGDPRVPDPDSLWGLILALRRGLDLWANIRPVKLLEGIPCPLLGRNPGDIDMLFFRENSEGEYSGSGARTADAAVEVAIFTRSAIERITRAAFDAAAGRRGLLTSATKSNALRHGYGLWDDVVDEVAADYPAVRVERVLVDALAARMIRDPASLDVVVASNLFGDILTDIAAALQGGLGMAASANIAPQSDTPGLFEPVHGSAPDIAGIGTANPIGALWSTVLMLEYLRETDAAARLMAAIEHVCASGPRTRDIGGDATTSEIGDAVAADLT